jgi:hypothetical protein
MNLFHDDYSTNSASDYQRRLKIDKFVSKCVNDLMYLNIQFPERTNKAIYEIYGNCGYKNRGSIVIDSADTCINHIFTIRCRLNETYFMKFNIEVSIPFISMTNSNATKNMKVHKMEICDFFTASGVGNNTDTQCKMERVSSKNNISMLVQKTDVEPMNAIPPLIIKKLDSKSSKIDNKGKEGECEADDTEADAEGDAEAESEEGEAEDSDAENSEVENNDKNKVKNANKHISDNKKNSEAEEDAEEADDEEEEEAEEEAEEEGEEVEDNECKPK